MRICPPDWTSSVWLCSRPGFAAVVLALSQTAEHGVVTAAAALVPLAIGVALLAGYGLHAHRAQRPPLIDLRLFLSRSFMASVTIMALSGLAGFATLFALPLYHQHAHGTLAAGLLVAPYGLAGAIAMPLAGRLSDRIGARGPASVGAAMATLSGLLLTRLTVETSVVWPIVGAFAIGLGAGLFSAPTMGSLYRTLPATMVAAGSSVLYMLNQLGAAFGVAVVALLMQTATTAMIGVHRVFWLIAATNVIVLVAIPLLPGRSHASAPAEKLSEQAA